MIVSADSAPALGDVRTLGEGSTIYLRPDVKSRKDWGRYQDAIAQAVGRGVDVRWVR